MDIKHNDKIEDSNHMYIQTLESLMRKNKLTSPAPLGESSQM